MPKKPSQEELNIIQEMFKASVDGELYDPDRFGQYYKPAGFNNSSSGGSTAKAKPVEAVAPAVAPATESVAQPVQSTPEPAKVEVTETVTATASEQPAPATASATATETGGKVSAEDILSMIRSRQAGK